MKQPDRGGSFNFGGYDMYAAYQTSVDWMAPWRAWSQWLTPVLQQASTLPVWPGSRAALAALKVFALSEVTHRRPAWDITSVLIKGEAVPVIDEVVWSTPFAQLRRFRAQRAGPEAPRVLVVAPMSGHFATLLRDTVRTMLQDHDVFVTDWLNVRDVALDAGRFGLDEYTEHLMQFLHIMGPGSHVLAVCQPCVSALMAAALMAEDGDPDAPASLTLMAGPIDCRIAPTEVNRLATTQPIDWFRSKLISRVPTRYAGANREVYPGVVQLSAFMSMNKQRHIDAFRGYYKALLEGDLEKAQATRTFYEEYLAVADLSADFYLETVERVFQTFDLPRGVMKYRDRVVRPQAIRRMALVTIEGERDDICAVGQTLAAHDLVPQLRSYLRTHYVQPNVGHYGVFSGRRWQHHIYPLVRNVIHVSG